MADGKTPARRPQVVVGPEALKAFAHPLRMALYAELNRRGSATASGLARALGESSGQTSYHLRQLERHGFVEDDPERTGGRERWWRTVGMDMRDPDLLGDPGTEAAARAVIHQVVAERTASLTAWASEVTPATHQLGLLSGATLALTPEELEDVTTRLAGALDAVLDPYRGRTAPPGAIRTRVYLDVFPLQVDQSEPAGSAG